MHGSIKTDVKVMLDRTIFLSNVAGHFPIENGQQISIWILKISRGPCVSPGFSSMATLPSNIAQKVAPCIIILKLRKTYSCQACESLFNYVGNNGTYDHTSLLKIRSLLKMFLGNIAQSVFRQHHRSVSTIWKVVTF